MRRRFLMAWQLGIRGVTGRLFVRLATAYRIFCFYGIRHRAVQRYQLALQPGEAIPSTYLAPLPVIAMLQRDPEALSPSDRRRILRLAQLALTHRIEVRGHGEVELNLTSRHWYDYDPKTAVMLNRHDFLVPLTQAWLVTGKTCYQAKINALFVYWSATYHTARLIQYDTPIDVAIRCLNWLWPLTFRVLPEDLDARVRTLVAVQLEYIFAWSSALANHLLLEALAHFVYGTFFAAHPKSHRWYSWGRKVVEREIHRQVETDGVHTEQSSFYHQLVTTHFLKAYLTAHRSGNPLPEPFVRQLQRMLQFVYHLTRPNGTRPTLGDGEPMETDDREHWEASVLLPALAVLYHQPVYRPFLASANDTVMWYLGTGRQDMCTTDEPPASHIYEQTGMGIIRHHHDYILFDAAPFGDPLIPHHGHADALSVELCLDGSTLLIDPGGYGYLDNIYRHYFRGTAAHNTVRLNRKNQSVIFDVFGYGRLATVALEGVECNGSITKLIGRHDGYAPVQHRREVYYRHRGSPCVMILDWLLGPGEHFMESIWHFAPGVKVDAHAQRVVDAAQDRSFAYAFLSNRDLTVHLIQGQRDPELQGWFSPATHQKEPIATLIQSGHVTLPCMTVMVIGSTQTHFDCQLEPPQLTLYGNHQPIIPLVLNFETGKSVLQ